MEEFKSTADKKSVLFAIEVDVLKRAIADYSHIQYGMSPMEWRIFLILTHTNGKYVRTDDLLDAIYFDRDAKVLPGRKIIHVRIYHIRRKLEAGGSKYDIQSAGPSGEGYRLVEREFVENTGEEEVGRKELREAEQALADEGGVNALALLSILVENRKALPTPTRAALSVVDDPYAGSIERINQLVSYLKGLTIELERKE